MAKVLVVEDDVFQSQLLVAMLSECGFEAVECNSEEEAYEAIESALTPFALAFCDMQLDDESTELGGLLVVKKLRENFGKQIKVISLTANEDIEVLDASIKAGADSHLLKPISQHDITKICDSV